MSIKTLFKSKQAVLESKLSVLLDHPVTQGDHFEGAWIDFFNSFLPNKYAVDKGFVFDSKGNISEQIDIIIYDALYAPLIFGTDTGEKFITAESVYAVFESKPQISKKTLEYANKKVASVANLVRSSRGMINAGRIVPPRELTHIIGGILAVDSLNSETILEHIQNTPYIDIGCGLRKTSFIVYRDNGGAIVDSQFSNQEESVISFFYMVLDSLYKLGTVAGLDIRDYADATVDSIKISRGES